MKIGILFANAAHRRMVLESQESLISCLATSTLEQDIEIHGLLANAGPEQLRGNWYQLIIVTDYAQRTMTSRFHCFADEWHKAMPMRCGKIIRL
jgi:hypothetical protein